MLLNVGNFDTVQFKNPFVRSVCSVSCVFLYICVMGRVTWYGRPKVLTRIEKLKVADQVCLWKLDCHASVSTVCPGNSPGKFWKFSVNLYFKNSGVLTLLFAEICSIYIACIIVYMHFRHLMLRRNMCIVLHRGVSRRPKLGALGGHIIVRNKGDITSSSSLLYIL